MVTSTSSGSIPTPEPRARWVCISVWAEPFSTPPSPRAEWGPVRQGRFRRASRISPAIWFPTCGLRGGGPAHLRGAPGRRRRDVHGALPVHSGRWNRVPDGGDSDGFADLVYGLTEGFDPGAVLVRPGDGLGGFGVSSLLDVELAVADQLPGEVQHGWRTWMGTSISTSSSFGTPACSRVNGSWPRRWGRYGWIRPEYERPRDRLRGSSRTEPLAAAVPRVCSWALAPRYLRDGIVPRRTAACFGYRFADIELLARAPTHRSWVEEHGVDNQRLEFLGDAVLGLVVAREAFCGLSEAEGMSEVRASRFERASSPRAGTESGRTSAGGPWRRRWRRESFDLADAYEAVIAAVFLDGGLEAVDAVMEGGCPPP